MGRQLPIAGWNRISRAPRAFGAHQHGHAVRIPPKPIRHEAAMAGVRALAYFAKGGLPRRGGVITNTTLPATKRSVTARTTMYGIVRSVFDVPSVREYTPRGIAQQGEHGANGGPLLAELTVSRRLSQRNQSAVPMSQSDAKSRKCKTRDARCNSLASSPGGPQEASSRFSRSFSTFSLGLQGLFQAAP